MKIALKNGLYMDLKAQPNKGYLLGSKISIYKIYNLYIFQKKIFNQLSVLFAKNIFLIINLYKKTYKLLFDM